MQILNPALYVRGLRKWPEYRVQLDKAIKNLYHSAQFIDRRNEWLNVFETLIPAV